MNVIINTWIPQSISIVPILFIVALSISCSPSKEENVINPLQENTTAFICEEISRISLSNDQEALIGTINDIQLYRDKYYILDTYQINGVSIFSQTGDFLFRTKIGKGPGELIFPYSFNLYNDTLMIADNSFRKF